MAVLRNTWRTSLRMVVMPIITPITNLFQNWGLLSQNMPTAEERTIDVITPGPILLAIKNENTQYRENVFASPFPMCTYLRR